jgi:hypothetical protein
MRRFILALGLLAMPKLCMAQEAVFKSDAAPYIPLLGLADGAMACGIRSQAWDNDASTALWDKLDYFATNLWGSTDAPDAQQAESDADQDAGTQEASDGLPSPAGCAKLARSDNLIIIDDLILNDRSITDSLEVVPGGIPANPADGSN